MKSEQSARILVTDRAGLHRVAEDLKREKLIGVDLESDSMFHYREKVCLIQISTPRRDILLDPLSLEDLSPISPIFADPGIRKVFHGADYDIRSLYRDFDIEVNSLFDTQIAARFLGIRETGLASLLKRELGVVLDKKYQKKDWSVRPLPEPMLAYAVHDTRHLIPLSNKLKKELRARGRLFWVEEECEILSRVRPAAPDESPLFLKFKGARKLDPRGLALLESILQLRDHNARGRDLPPFKILGNEPILEIATRRPATEKDLMNIKGMSARQVKTLGPSILKRARESAALPEKDLPSFPARSLTRTGSRIGGKFKALKTWRDRRAEEMGVDPSLVCTNAQIESLVLASPRRRKDLEEIDNLRAWQRRLFGGEICRALKDTA